MPLIVVLPIAAGVLGFGAGWFSNDNYGWLKWLVIGGLAYLFLKNKKMV